MSEDFSVPTASSIAYSEKKAKAVPEKRRGRPPKPRTSDAFINEVKASRADSDRAKLEISRINLKRKVEKYYKAFPALRKTTIPARDDTYEYWYREWQRCKNHGSEDFQEGMFTQVIVQGLRLLEYVCNNYYNPFGCAVDYLSLYATLGCEEWKQSGIEDDIKILCIEYDIFKLDVHWRIFLKIGRFIQLLYQNGKLGMHPANKLNEAPSPTLSKKFEGLVL